MNDKLAWMCVGGTVAFTIYGQVILKWRVRGVALPGPFAEKLWAILGMLADPWVLSGFLSAFVASLFWIAAMTRLPLNLAYPFTSMSFVLIVLFGTLFLHEPLTVSRFIGVLVVTAGLILLSRA